MNKAKNDWFEYWFDTPYYHILYNHRNDSEAKFFMRNLRSFLQLKKGETILDLPCGKGRHAIFLNTQGFDVTGADLSSNSITAAKKYENKTLRFSVHDMRDSLFKKYHAIFNLFTSFGYFDDEETNENVLKKMKAGLLPNGHIVIDFLNIKKVESELIAEETIIKSDIHFLIKRHISEGLLIKNIYFEADGKQHHYTEKVQCLDLSKMETFAKNANLNIKHVFGDYNLTSFNPKTSNRLILILQ